MARSSQGKPARRNQSAASSRQPAQARVPASPPEIKRHNGWLTLAVCLFLGLCVWAVFGQTLQHDFVNYDDDQYVYANAAITRGLSLDGAAWAFMHVHFHNWHPLTTLSHMLDCQLYGLKPWGHHLTNVLLHATAAMLLFGALKKLTGTFWRSALVAAIFAIHPLRVESVAWVSERKDVLSGVFFMLTLWAYARYAQHRKGEAPEGSYGFLRHRSYWLTLGMFALGLMSKPMLVTVPFILLLLDYWPLGRFTLGRLLWEKIPFLVLSVAASGIAMLTQKEVIETGADVEVPARIGNAVVSYAVYLWQMMYPVGLAVPYPHPGNHLPLWQVMVAALVLLMVSIAVFLGRKRRPYGLVGWLWYVGMLVPVIGLV
jgi:protein O-mannosyl-transferase